MNKRLRSLARRLLPNSVAVRIWNTYCNFRSRRARIALHEADRTPAFLGWDELDDLQNSYPPVEWDYHYDEESLWRRGRERVRTMLTLVASEKDRLHRFLDLGAWDGMSCAILQQMGKEAVGIDIRPEGFSDHAARTGAAFLQMDASHLGFSSDSFDFVFSFNSFEHFSDPDAVLRNVLRVLRPGGFLYLDFGPLYWSAKGAHQFKTINVPYNQCLFSRDLLQAYAEEKNLELMGFFWMNEWPVQRYRDLWQKYEPGLERVHYLEIRNADHVDLIERYPSCFRSKSDCFDDFVVAYVEALFRKAS